ncbi:hypothetical protein F4803DRAFT_517006 [Xylaria telfairii]|nr:hypothetical protein F4803DRAFT_517006 [Xylaria telfairii]
MELLRKVCSLSKFSVCCFVVVTSLAQRETLFLDNLSLVYLMLHSILFLQDRLMRDYCTYVVRICSAGPHRHAPRGTDI